MFKKSLAAVAVLGAFAGSALAADVQLYGLVDLGLNWTQVDNGKTTTDSFGMGSGQNSGSRFGLKGTEDLGNGYKVGFNLENSFKADDGALDKGSRLFHRESILFVQTPYGELSAGRTGGLDSGVGRYGQMGSGATAMSTGWDNIAKTGKVFLGLGDRMDNTLTYQSPKFAGVTVLAQASLKKSNVNDKGVAIETEEGSSDADRYYALGVTYGAGALNAGLVYSQTDWNRTDLKDQTNDDNQTVVSAFANYDFGMVKPMVAVQYFDGGKDVDVADTALNKGYGSARRRHAEGSARLERLRRREDGRHRRQQHHHRRRLRIPALQAHVRLHGRRLHAGQDRKGWRRNEDQDVRSHARHGPQVLITACSHRTSV